MVHNLQIGRIQVQTFNGKQWLHGLLHPAAKSCSNNGLASTGMTIKLDGLEVSSALYDVLTRASKQTRIIVVAGWLKQALKKALSFGRQRPSRGVWGGVVHMLCCSAPHTRVQASRHLCLLLCPGHRFTSSAGANSACACSCCNLASVSSSLSALHQTGFSLNHSTKIMCIFKDCYSDKPI